MFQMQHRFSNDDLTRLLSLALKKYSKDEAKFECVTINCDENGQVSGYVFMRPGAHSEGFDKKSTTVTLSRELITAAIYQAASDEGYPLAADSLLFGKSPEQSQSVSAVTATATPADQAAQKEEIWSTGPTVGPRIVAFPQAVSVCFDNQELQELLKTSGKRFGYEISTVSLSSNETNEVTAKMTITTGTGKDSASSSLALSQARLTDTLTTELTTRGYFIADNGLQLGPDDQNNVCATVTVSAIPNH